MEWDDERSGSFEPLRLVPPGKQVVLGLVTTKRGALESKDELKRRIDEASRHVPIEQLCISPQGGFSSTVEGNALSYDEQIAKLKLIVEVAEVVPGEACRQGWGWSTSGVLQPHGYVQPTVNVRLTDGLPVEL